MTQLVRQTSSIVLELGRQPLVIIIWLSRERYDRLRCNGKREKKKKMIEVVLDDRLGKKVRVKCNEDDTIGDLKKLAAAQLGTRPEKLRIQKWYTVYKVCVHIHYRSRRKGVFEVARAHCAISFFRITLRWMITNFTMAWVWNCKL